VIARAKSIDELSQYNSDKAVKDQLHGLDRQSIKYVPLAGKKKDLTVVVNGKTGEMIKVVDLLPWPIK
jgi:hypothetical protein